MLCRSKACLSLVSISSRTTSPQQMVNHQKRLEKERDSLIKKREELVAFDDMSDIMLISVLRLISMMRERKLRKVVRC